MFPLLLTTVFLYDCNPSFLDLIQCECVDWNERGKADDDRNTHSF